MFGGELREQAAGLLDLCRLKSIKLATAESCTGGLFSALLTEVPGSSDVFERGFVTYSNEAKIELLGVPEQALAIHGAVSEEAACAMAEGALKRSRATLAVSITGIAGPGGGSAQKPVGLVHIACAVRGHQTHHERHIFPGSRAEIRLASVEAALALMRLQAALLP